MMYVQVIYHYNSIHTYRPFTYVALILLPILQVLVLVIPSHFSQISFS